MDLLSQINQELSASLSKVLDLEDQLAAIEAALEEARTEFNKLNRAYKALTGNDGGQDKEPAGQNAAANRVETPSAVEVPAPVVKAPTNSGPVCHGCGGEMERGFRTLQNGRTVNLWICKDSGCNNEALA